MDDDRHVRFVHRRRRSRVAIRRPLRDHRNPLEEWDEEECYTYLRILPQSVMWIMQLLADRLTRPTNCSGSIPALLQVVLALHCLASGAFLNTVSRMVGVSQFSARLVCCGTSCPQLLGCATITSCGRQRRSRSIGLNRAFIHWTVSIPRQCLSNIFKSNEVLKTPVICFCVCMAAIIEIPGYETPQIGA